jgi:hypothetical protein
VLAGAKTLFVDEKKPLQSGASLPFPVVMFFAFPAQSMSQKNPQILQF